MTTLKLKITNHNYEELNTLTFDNQTYIFQQLSTILAKRLYSKKDNKIKYVKDFKNDKISIYCTCTFSTTIYFYTFTGDRNELESITNYL